MESQRSNNNNNSSSSSSSNNNNNNSGSSRRGARPSVGYLLFQYQTELTRRNAEPSRLSRTKMHIIDGLVSRTIRHMKHCSLEELQNCKRELVYKEQLREELRNMRRRKNSTSSSTGSNCDLNASFRCSSTSAAAKAPIKPIKPIKPPSTPPKPCIFNLSKVSLYGPEIFV